jgi:nitrite reductase (NADH) large subunit
MARHVADYSDEWADTLADPRRLARFSSFVNAPDQPDPSIRFVNQRGQIQPAGPVLIAGPTLQLVRP